MVSIRFCVFKLTARLCQKTGPMQKWGHPRGTKYSNLIEICKHTCTLTLLLITHTSFSEFEYTLSACINFSVF